MRVTIYSDGGSDPNPGVGGWGAILIYGENEKELSGSHPQATNNRMELTAAIEALRALKRPCKIDFYVDSKYVLRGITEWAHGWAARDWQREGRPIQNVDLWKQLLPLSKKHRITWRWVKGHAGDEYNERVDKLARAARLEITPDDIIDRNKPCLYLRSSCIGNPGIGGWGAVLEYRDETEQISGNIAYTTNNRLEILAAVEGVSILPAGSPVQIFTTSDYLFQGATKWVHGWRRRDWKKTSGLVIANADLWQRLDKVMESAEIRWINAKGRSDPGLKAASKLASDAARLLK